MEDTATSFGYSIGLMLAPVLMGFVLALPAFILNRRRGGTRNAGIVVIAACIAAAIVFRWPGALIAAIVALPIIWYVTRAP